MEDESSTATDQPVTNVLQIVALNMICIVLTVSGLKLFGFSWSTSIFLGWLGAMPFTLAIAFGIISLTEWLLRDAAQNETSGDRVGKISDPISEASKAAHIQMWQEDAFEDEWAALAHERERARAEDAGDPLSEAPAEYRRHNRR
jgi:hypothetical protein